MTAGNLAWWSALMAANQFEDGSLDIEDSTLSVDGGSTVNLRVRLGARPRSDVTVALSETSALISLGSSSLTFTRGNWDTYQSVAVTAAGNRQEITLPHDHYAENRPSEFYGWDWLTVTDDPQIISGLTGGTMRWLGRILFYTSTAALNQNNVDLHFEDTVTGGGAPGHDLSPAFETNGQVEIRFGGSTYVFSLDGADTEDPYLWVPSNASDVDTLADALSVASDRSGTMILRDYVSSAATISLSASGPDEYSGVTGSATVSVD